MGVGAWVFTTPPNGVTNQTGIWFGDSAITSYNIISDNITTKNASVGNVTMYTESTSSQDGMYIYDTGAGAAFKAISHGTGGNANAGVFRVEGAGTDTALHVQRTLAIGNPASSQSIMKIYRDNSNTQDTGVMLYIYDINTGNNANMDGILVDRQATAGYGVHVSGKNLYTGTVSKSGGIGINIGRNLNEAGSQFIALFTENNVANTIGVERIINAGYGIGLLINQTGAGGIPLNINNTGTQGDIQLDVNISRGRPTGGKEGQIAYDMINHTFVARNSTGWWNVTLS